jgi:hypothetical protein
MIEKLQNFIGITDETSQWGLEIWRVIEPRTDAILETFYAKIGSFHIDVELTEKTIARLMAKQKQHWRALFNSKFDEGYANSVRRLGIRHREINLDPAWYVLGYATLKGAFTEVIIDSQMPPIKKGRLIKALDKYVAFDMALALSTYNAIVFD